VLFHGLVPPIAGEAGIQHDLGHAQRPGSDDAVADAGDPAGIGRAPVHVVFLQIEDQLGRQVLGEEAGVDVQSALRLARRAAGVVQQARALGVRLENRERLDPVAVHVIGDFALAQAPFLVAVVDDDDGLQVGQTLDDLAHFRQVLVLGDDGDGAAVIGPLEEGLLAESREKRLHDRPGLQDTHHADVQLGNAVQEYADAVGGVDPLLGEERGPPVGQLLEVLIGVLPDLAFVVLMDQGLLVAPSLFHVAIDAVVAQVDRLVLRPAQFAPGHIPAHLATQLFVVEAHARHTSSTPDSPATPARPPPGQPHPSYALIRPTWPK